MDGVEKNGRDEGDDGPQKEGPLFVPPGFAGEEEDLKGEERPEETHPEPQPEDQPGRPEMLTDGVEGQHQERGSRRMERVPGAFLPPGHDVALGDGHGFDLIGAVILPGVVIGQVEVAFVEEAVGHEQVVRFIPGEAYALFDQNQRSDVECSQGRKEKSRRFSSGGEPGRIEKPDGERPGTTLPPGAELNDFENDHRCEGPCQKEPRPDKNVRRAQVMNQRPGGEAGQGQRTIGPCVTAEDFFERLGQEAGDGPGIDEPKGIDRQEGQGDKSRQRDGPGAEHVLEKREPGARDGQALPYGEAGGCNQRNERGREEGPCLHDSFILLRTL